MIRRFSSKLAARLLLRISAKNRWRDIHAVADAHEVKLKRVVRGAFAAGLKTVDRKDLREALDSRAEAQVLDIASAAIIVTENWLKADLEQVFRDILNAAGDVGARHLKTQLRASSLRTGATIKGFKFDVTNPAAVEWVRNHAAETITGISKTTRESIRDLVESSFEEQFDVDELADHIAYVLGDGDDARAETIARTESMRAANEGQKELWDQATTAGLLTGDERQEWITTPDDRLCPICEPMDGVTVALGDQFDVAGELLDGPPAHPRCRCTLALSL